jgi:uncharacterized membrane protein
MEIHRQFPLEMLIFFSDAVFAIVMTLLVVEIRLPPDITDQDLTQGILALVPQVAAFALSFAVIGTYWLAHHRYFRYIEQWDGRLILWNFDVAFLRGPAAHDDFASRRTR